MLNYDRYNELTTQINALKKEADALKKAIISELEKTAGTMNGEKIIYQNEHARLTISPYDTIKQAAAWDLIKSTENPDLYINHGTRNNLTVN